MFEIVITIGAISALANFLLQSFWFYSTVHKPKGTSSEHKGIYSGTTAQLKVKPKVVRKTNLDEIREDTKRQLDELKELEKPYKVEPSA